MVLYFFFLNSNISKVEIPFTSNLQSLLHKYMPSISLQNFKKRKIFDKDHPLQFYKPYDFLRYLQRAENYQSPVRYLHLTFLQSQCVTSHLETMFKKLQTQSQQVWPLNLTSSYPDVIQKTHGQRRLRKLVRNEPMIHLMT